MNIRKLERSRMMKTQSNFPKALSIAVLFVLASAFAAIWQTTRVSAFNPQPDPPAFAYIGISFSQTARLSVVTDRDVAQGPCRNIELQFVDARGHTLVHSIQPLRAGRAVFLDLDRNEIQGAENARVEVRGVVKCPADPSAPASDSDRGGPSLFADVQVFNNETGKTEVVLPAVQSIVPAVQR